MSLFPLPLSLFYALGYGTERMRQKLFVPEFGVLVNTTTPAASAGLVTCDLSALPMLLPPAEDREPHRRLQRHRENPAAPQALGPAGASASDTQAGHTPLRCQDSCLGG